MWDEAKVGESKGRKEYERDGGNNRRMGYTREGVGEGVMEEGCERGGQRRELRYMGGRNDRRGYQREGRRDKK